MNTVKILTHQINNENLVNATKLRGIETFLRPDEAEGFVR